MASINKRLEMLERQLQGGKKELAEARGSNTVPAYMVRRLDSIFCNCHGVDTVELAALLIEITGNAGLPE